MTGRRPSPASKSSISAWPLRARATSRDLLTQVAGIHPLNERWAFAAGSQFTFSTASLSTTGSEKYVALPGGVLRYMIPELSPGRFVAPEVRYQFDTGGDPHRHHLSDLQRQPLLNWQLPHDTFVNLFPSADIRIKLGFCEGKASRR